MNALTNEWISATPEAATMPRVLVVEDDSGIALFIQRALVQAGYRVDLVGDGLSALAADHAPQPLC